MHDDVAASGVLTESARSALETLLVQGPLSRAELSRRLSLSKASLTKISRPLVEGDYVVELEGDVPVAAGRPAQPLDINVHFAHFAGVKLTGDGIFVVSTDARGRALEERQAALTSTDPAAVADMVAAQVVALHERDARIAGVGIALSGNAMRASAIVRNSPFLHWTDVPLADMVAERTGLPVVLENDVRAVTAAQQWFGAGVTSNSFALLTLGAGIGCGIVVNGTQVEGHLGASGLVGHLRVSESGPLCYAGHAGCAHAYATTSAIAARISLAQGAALTFDEAVALFEAGDAVAAEAFAAAGRAIGAILATVVNILGPDRILVSGEGYRIYELAREAAVSRMRELLHWTATEIAIEAQEFGFVEWARGAAVVAVQEHVRRMSARRETAVVA